MTKASFDTGSDTLERVKNKIKEPSKYKVLLLNDDFTTMEFVIEVLRRVFHHSAIEATSIMLSVHNHGKGVAGVYTKDIAEAKMSQVRVISRTQGFPLKCEMEKE